MIKTISKNWTVILVAGLGIMAIAGWNLKTIIDEIKGFLSPNSDVDQVKSESGSTLSDTAASILAETLYDAMEGTGTDEHTIYLAFKKMANRADFNKVYNAFGKRQYSRTWGNVGDPVTSSRYDLIQWLAYELTNEERNKLVQDNSQLQIFG
jgi:hypothetical protein